MGTPRPTLQDLQWGHPASGISILLGGPCLRTRRLVVRASVNENDTLVFFKLESFQNSGNVLIFCLREIENHLYGTLGVTRFLIDLCLMRQVLFQIGIAGQFEVNQGLVPCPARDLKVSGATTVVYFAADVGRGGKPSQPVENVDVRFSLYRLALHVEDFVSALVFDYIFKKTNSSLSFPVGQ